MSRYVEVVLRVHCQAVIVDDEDTWPQIDELNARLNDRGHGYAGQLKQLGTMDVFGDDMKNLNEEWFVEQVRSIAWEDRESVQLFMCSEDDERMREVELW